MLASFLSLLVEHEKHSSRCTDHVPSLQLRMRIQPVVGISASTATAAKRATISPPSSERQQLLNLAPDGFPHVEPGGVEKSLRYSYYDKASKPYDAAPIPGLCIYLTSIYRAQ